MRGRTLVTQMEVFGEVNGVTRGLLRLHRRRKLNQKKTPTFSTSWTTTTEPEKLTSQLQTLKIADTPSKKSKKKEVEEITEKPALDDDLKQSLYKTELCRSFVDTGICRYGHKCQFAHGAHEIRPLMRHPKYKTENCKTFVASGHCPYGNRCRFIHPPSSTSGAQWSSSWNENDENEKEIPYPLPEDIMPTVILESTVIPAKSSPAETMEEKEKRLSFFRRLAS